MRVASATAIALRDGIAAALARECPADWKLIVRGDQPDILLTMATSQPVLAVEVVPYPLDYNGIMRRERANAEVRIPSVWYVDPGRQDTSLIERRFNPETADYGYGDIIDVAQDSVGPWGRWLKVTGCELF